MVVGFRRPALLAALAAVLTVTACTSGQSTDRASAGQGRPAPAVARPMDARKDRDAPGETSAARDPVSTFAVDIDTASYGYASRLINEGRLPERSAVRPEEFINSFTQDYPEPRGNGFAVHVDGARLPDSHEPGPDRTAGDESEPAAGGDVRLLRVGLRTRADDATSRPDAALTFVVDVSGSMAEPGRLDLVRDALHTLVDQLRPTDSVAIVAFSNQARVVRKMTPASDAKALHDAIDSLHSEGGTNLEDGLVRGYQVAREGFRAQRTNRVIILSDGLANIGDTEAEPILRRVREEANKQIALLGVGVGSEFGDRLMEQLADRGDGFVVYVAERAQARELFVRRLPATLTVRALDAKVQVTFDPATVRSYRLVGYANRTIADQDFRDDTVDGGEVGPGHSVTALYAVRLAGQPAESARVAQVGVRWLDPVTRAATEVTESVEVRHLAPAFAQASPRLRVCYAAGYFAEALRHSEYGAEVQLAELARIARDAAGQTEDPRVRELAALIDRARELD